MTEPIISGCACHFAGPCDGDGLVACDKCGGESCICLCGGTGPCPGCPACRERLQIEGDYNSDPYELAKDLGLAVVLPADDELFVDIDSPADAARFKEAIGLLGKGPNPFVVVRDTPSASGGANRHVVVRVPFKLTPVERVAWQAALGSDRNRSMLELRDLRENPSRVATCFFEKPS